MKLPAPDATIHAVVSNSFTSQLIQQVVLHKHIFELSTPIPKREKGGLQGYFHIFLFLLKNIEIGVGSR